MKIREEHHQVISLSNASLQLYPENTLTRFSHRLPNKIVFDAHRSISVALNTIVLASSLKRWPVLRSEEPSFIKVHLKEIDPGAAAGHSDSQLLARFPFEHGKIAWHRPRVPVLLPLAAGRELTELSFLITDENNQQLDLAEGPPTLIQLDVMVSDKAGSFSLTLDEETSRDLHENNTPTSWISELPESIRLDPGLEVCLHSVQVPRSVLFEKSFIELRLHRKIHGVRFADDISHPSDAVHRFKLDSSQDYTENELLQRAFKPFLRSRGVKLFLSSKNDGSLQLGTMRMSEGDKILNGIKSTIDEFYMLRMSPFTAQLFGLPFDPVKGATFQLVDGSYRIREAVRRYHRSRAIKMPEPDNVAIYCDLVESSIIGNAIAPIVDVLPTSKLGAGKVREGALYILENPIFRSVNPHATNSIQVNIRLLDGSEPKIVHEENEPKKPISLVFVFRKRQ